MKEETIILITFIALILFGAYKCTTEPKFEKRCETYLHGDYNEDTKTCEITTEKPMKEPEKNPNYTLRELLGGKVDCNLNYSEVPDPKKHPFTQNISVVCNNMKLNITFKESLNDYSKALIQRVEDFNRKCQLFDKTKSSLIPLSNTYEYNYYEFGWLHSKNLTGYKELANRDAETPMICHAPIHNRVKQPTKKISKKFPKCNVINSETPDLNAPSKQNITAICDGINVIFEFDNVINTKQR